MAAQIGVVAAVVALFVTAAQQPGHAQDSGSASSLAIHLVPYIWLPTIDTTVKYPVLGGGTATTTTSTGPGDYIPKLHFATMLAGEIDYDRFSLATDIIYLSLGASSARLRSFDFGYCSRSDRPGYRCQPAKHHLDRGGRLHRGLGQLGERRCAGRLPDACGQRDDGLFRWRPSSQGPTAASPWVAPASCRPGERSGTASAESAGDSISATPTGSAAGNSICRSTLTSAEADRIRPGRRLAASAIRRELVGLALGYRYLSFQQGGSAIIQKLALGGPIIVADFRF